MEVHTSTAIVQRGALAITINLFVIPRTCAVLMQHAEWKTVNYNAIAMTASRAGDGETCTNQFADCYDAYQAGHRQDGEYTILPHGCLGCQFSVWCDMNTEGGGWTVSSIFSTVSAWIAQSQ